MSKKKPLPPRKRIIEAATIISWTGKDADGELVGSFHDVAATAHAVGWCVELANKHGLFKALEGDLFLPDVEKAFKQLAVDIQVLGRRKS